MISKRWKNRRDGHAEAHRRTLRERADALIAIAHPEDREALQRARHELAAR